MTNFPKVIYFCNKSLNSMEKYASNWKKINPEYEIKLYDDNLCEQFLLNEYGQLHLDIFRFITDGPIKADFWRVCILHKYGGIYSDIDNQPLVPIKDFLDDSVDFVTCSSYWVFNFNPNFIVSNKNNPILEKCINWYINKFLTKSPYSYWGWSVMQTFTDVLVINNYNKNEGIYDYNNMKIQIIKECSGTNHYDAHNIYKNQRIFNNRYQSWDSNTHSFFEDQK